MVKQADIVPFSFFQYQAKPGTVPALIRITSVGESGFTAFDFGSQSKIKVDFADITVGAELELEPRTPAIAKMTLVRDAELLRNQARLLKEQLSALENRANVLEGTANAITA